MRTYYLLLWISALLAVSVILLSSSLLMWKFLLIGIVIGITFWEWCRFSVRSVMMRNDKILVMTATETYEAHYLPTSIIGRYLCFLHLESISPKKCWYIPISRLEFAREDFRMLKCRFSMLKN